MMGNKKSAFDGLGGSKKVPPRVELGLPESEPGVITT